MKKSSYKTPKLRGRWSTANRENLGVIYTCPNCSNKNTELLLNSENKPYCSSCLVKCGTVHIMKNRTMYSHRSKKRRN